MSIKAAFIVPHPPLILPEVGRGEEKEIQKTIDAYDSIARQIAALKPRTIVLTSPHAVLYADYFHISPGSSASGDLGRFNAPTARVSVAYDPEFVRALTKNAKSTGLPAGTLGERDPSLDHATVIPLRFLEKYWKDYQLVRIGLSGLPLPDHYRLGMQIAKTAEELQRDTVFIASGDLSHRVNPNGPYGFAEEGPIFDAYITEAMDKADFAAFLNIDQNMSEKAAECGLRSFVIMAGALDGKALKSELLSYEGVTGVGYGCASFYVTGEDTSRHFLAQYQNSEKARLAKIKASEDEYVRLARLSLETYVNTNDYAKRPRELSPELLNQQAGVFVSLKKDGVLRGCIGTISPVTACVADEIIRNAVSAGTEDPRFQPVQKSELPDLIYDVDVLSEAEDIQSPDQLDVKRYGVIVTHGGRRGLLLPNLDGVDTVEDQISIARRKAGISESEKVSLQRFEVIRHL